jgi:hypothetical protein
MENNLKVLGVRYFETRRGMGYECKTNKLNVFIWNDGNGGGTYIAPYYPYTKDYDEMTEDEMENLIDQYEGVIKED